MKSTKVSDIAHNKHQLDAKGAILGRLASKAAQLLVGKSKPYFVRHLDCGDFVTIINAKDIKVTGNKESQKTYGHYSGYPGGLKVKPLKKIREENPAEILTHAISGMLPNNKLRDQWMKRLIVIA